MFQMLVVLLHVYTLLSAAVKLFEKITQMGGSGIWCRIHPQGACNYINAAQ